MLKNNARYLEFYEQFTIQVRQRCARREIQIAGVEGVWQTYVLVPEILLLCVGIKFINFSPKRHNINI